MIVQGKPGDIELPGKVPTVITPEAWDAAMLIDSVVEKHLYDAGLVRRTGATKLPELIAMAIQHAINRSHAAVLQRRTM